MMSTSQPKNVPIKAPTAAELRKFQSLNAARLLARRTADGLDREYRDAEARLLAYCRSQGRKRKLERAGFELEILQVPGSVYWKGAFIETCGQEAADILMASQPPRDKLEVRRRSRRQAG